MFEVNFSHFHSQLYNKRLKLSRLTPKTPKHFLLVCVHLTFSSRSFYVLPVYMVCSCAVVWNSFQGSLCIIIHLSNKDSKWTHAQGTQIVKTVCVTLTFKGHKKPQKTVHTVFNLKSTENLKAGSTRTNHHDNYPHPRKSLF